jgi:hypothetical protein
VYRVHPHFPVNTVSAVDAAAVATGYSTSWTTQKAHSAKERMLNSSGNEVLTELSLNGVGVRDLMFRASTAQSWTAGRNPIAGLRFSRNGTTA